MSEAIVTLTCDPTGFSVGDLVCVSSVGWCRIVAVDGADLHLDRPWWIHIYAVIDRCFRVIHRVFGRLLR